MTNYQKLCEMVDIYEAGNNHRFYDFLLNAGLNELVNRHIFHPNDEAMVDMAMAIFPAWENRALIQSCNNRWFHARLNDWSRACWIYCPASCNELAPTSPDFVKSCGALAAHEIFSFLEKDYGRTA